MRFTFDDEGYYVTGYPTVCYDGALAPICDTTNLDGLDISSICLEATELASKQINSVG